MNSIKKIKELRVDEYTSSCTFTAELDTKISSLINIMVENEIRHLPIIDKGKAVGIVSDRDIKLVSNFDGANNMLASHIMTPDPYRVVTGTCLETVVFEMAKSKIGSALVVDSDEKIIGIFTLQDALNALVELLRGDIP